MNDVGLTSMESPLTAEGNIENSHNGVAVKTFASSHHRDPVFQDKASHIYSPKPLHEYGEITCGPAVIETA
jgi:hypothetical protein